MGGGKLATEGCATRPRRPPPDANQAKPDSIQAKEDVEVIPAVTHSIRSARLGEARSDSDITQIDGSAASSATSSGAMTLRRRRSALLRRPAQSPVDPWDNFEISFGNVASEQARTLASRVGAP